MGITSLRQYHEAPEAAEVSSEAPAAEEAPVEATAEAPTETVATEAPAETVAVVTTEPVEFEADELPEVAEVPDPFEPEAAPDLDGLNRGSSRAAWATYGEAEAGVVVGWTDGMTRDQLAAHYLGAKAE